jgi:glycosyltransferase involved in cell wall biosynthesis
VRVLLVAPYPPTAPLSGGRRRIYEQLRALGRHGEVDVACLTYSPYDESQLGRLSLPGVRFHPVRLAVRPPARSRPDASIEGWPSVAQAWWSDELRERVAALAAEHEYDWALAEHCFAAPYVEDLAVPELLTGHNVEYRVLEQIAAHEGDLAAALSLSGRPGRFYRFAARQLPLMRRFEEERWRRADRCVVVSDVERRIVTGARGDDRVHVIPNCPEPDAGGASLRAGPPGIAMVGALDYFPNVDALVHLVERVLPLVRRRRPDVDVVVAGRDPTPSLVTYCLRAGLRVVPNPATTWDVLTSGSVAACPLRFGAGTRIKVLDAMAAGVPVVASTRAVEGLRVAAGREVVVADAPHEFAAALDELLSSESSRLAQARAGREFLDAAGLRWSTAFAGLEAVLSWRS